MSWFQGTFYTLFSNLPNLEKLELFKFEMTDDDPAGTELLANAIRNGQLKSLIIRKPIELVRNMNIFNDLPGSAMETLILEGYDIVDLTLTQKLKAKDLCILKV